MPAFSLKSWQNTLHAALDPAKATIMLGKIQRRFLGEKGRLDNQQNLDWLGLIAEDIPVFLTRFGATPDLLRETDQFCTNLKTSADEILSRIPHDLGGGGGVPLLYALTRLLRPNVIVETGVAAGFSSATFLAALAKNGSGKLYSSDFPYFRIENPEQYVGIVVPAALKQNWSLHIKGDSANLPAILKECGPIDLFHYDSDKSYQGRAMAFSLILPRMMENGLVIMDDIQDNSFFHDWVMDHSDTPWTVLKYEGKYIGLLGKTLPAS
jgi:predicted O-methyltransferase YrrM